MKRVFATALAITLVFCGMFQLSVGAIDPTNILGYSEDAEILNGDYVEDFGNIILGTQGNTLEIPFYFENFSQKDPSQALIPEDITSEIVNKMTLKSDPPSILPLFAEIDKHAWTPNAGGKIILTCYDVCSIDGELWVEWQDSGEKSARIPIKGNFVDPTIDKTIVGIADRAITGSRSGVTLEGKQVDTSKHLDVRPGDELRIYLDTDTFVWEPNIRYTAAPVRKSTLDADNITVKKKILSGDAAIDEIVIENINGRAFVVVRFADTFDSIKEKDFRVEIGLAQLGSWHQPSIVEIYGTISNEIIYVETDNDFVNLEEGSVVEATQFVRNIEMNLGYGVTAWANLNTDTKYYGRVTDQRKNLDEEIFDAFPEFRSVLHMKNVNLPGSTRIRIDTDELLYVYNETGKYLGSTDEDLPVSSSYYFAAVRYIVDPELEIQGFDEYIGTDNPSTGAVAVKTALGLGMLALLIGVIVGKDQGMRGSRDKKLQLAALLLAVVLVMLLLPVPASAATTPKIVTITDNFYQDWIGSAATNPERTRPGDEILIPLMWEGFKDKDGMNIDWDGKNDLGPSRNQLSANRVKAVLVTQAGSAVIRDIDIVKFTPTKRIRAQSAIRIRFAQNENMINTKEIRYEFKVRLQLDGKLASETLPFDGMISNDFVDVYSRHDYVYLGDHEVAIAKESVSGIEVDMGSGVVMYTDLVNGQKYYAVARGEEDDTQDDILRNTYSEITEIYTLHTVNMKTEFCEVFFKDIPADQKYHVYNIKGEYLGTTNERLPYSERYYLATAPIDIDVDLIRYEEVTKEHIESERFQEFRENYLNEVQNS